jgi:hypothetical protein
MITGIVVTAFIILTKGLERCLGRGNIGMGKRMVCTTLVVYMKGWEFKRGIFPGYPNILRMDVQSGTM